MTGETVNSARLPRHTARDVAHMLQISETWLKEQARLRRIPFALLAGTYRFSDAHLEAIAETFEVQPDGPPASSPRRSRVQHSTIEPILRVRPEARQRRARTTEGTE